VTSDTAEVCELREQPAGSQNAAHSPRQPSSFQPLIRICEWCEYPFQKFAAEDKSELEKTYKAHKEALG
jgi:hypothetical protein